MKSIDCSDSLTSAIFTSWDYASSRPAGLESAVVSYLTQGTLSPGPRPLQPGHFLSHSTRLVPVVSEPAFLPLPN